jgi:hypothetical protein
MSRGDGKDPTEGRREGSTRDETQGSDPRRERARRARLPGRPPAPRRRDRPQRSGLLRGAWPERPPLPQRRPRGVLRPEAERPRDHPSRRADRHQRGRAAAAHARAVGPGGPIREARARDLARPPDRVLRVPGAAAELPHRGARRGGRSPRGGAPRPAAARGARGKGGVQPGVPSDRLLRQVLPHGRRLRGLPAPPGRAHGAGARRDGGAAAPGLREERRPVARGSPDAGDDRLRDREADALRRPQQGPERLVRGAKPRAVGPDRGCGRLARASEPGERMGSPAGGGPQPGGPRASSA